jgi:ABC-type branched-subunit amino acid transport system ATPase component
VQAGQVHALIGPNGAGKTTTFNLISGMFTPDAGEVLLHGKSISNLSADQICQQGLARSFQITNLFKGLTIYENLRLSLQARHSGRFNIWRDVDSYQVIQDETNELMKFLGLEGMETVIGADLSYGGQRLVDLGIALGSKPLVLLMDEPLAGLAAAERERISHLIKTIASSIPVLIVEHDIDRVLALSQQVTVMNQGEVLMSGNPDEVRQDARVQEVYTGTGVPLVTDRTVTPVADRQMVLDIRSIDLESSQLTSKDGRNCCATRKKWCRQDHIAKVSGGVGATCLRGDFLKWHQPDWNVCT